MYYGRQPHSYCVAAAQEEEINQIVRSSIPRLFLAARAAQSLNRNKNKKGI
jgi:hypothetical protein